MLEFDADTSRRLEDAYQGSVFNRRRLANLLALDPRPGQRLIDIGCGPGFLTVDLSRAVGDSGEVVGIDPSADMRAAASRRCSSRDNVTILEGDANDLRCADASADGAVSVQVFEYVADIPGALAEAARVLRPGARLVIGDIHWDSLVWPSGDPARMARVIAAWDDHLADRCVPERLPALMRDAGFVVEAVAPFTVCDTVIRPDGYGETLLTVAAAFARDRGGLDQNEVAAWQADQRDRDRAGRFFFSLTHVVVTGRLT